MFLLPAILKIPQKYWGSTRGRVWLAEDLRLCWEWILSGVFSWKVLKLSGEYGAKHLWISAFKILQKSTVTTSFFCFIFLQLWEHMNQVQNIKLSLKLFTEQHIEFVQTFSKPFGSVFRQIGGSSSLKMRHRLFVNVNKSIFVTDQTLFSTLHSRPVSLSSWMVVAVIPKLATALVSETLMVSLRFFV